MQFRDLKKQYEVLRPQMDAAMIEVAASSAYIGGPQVKTLEDFEQLCRRNLREGFHLFTNPAFPKTHPCARWQ